MSKEELKKDIRNKIMIGNLIIKAGLDKYCLDDKTIMLELLLDLKRKLDNKTYHDEILKSYRK